MPSQFRHKTKTEQQNKTKQKTHKQNNTKQTEQGKSGRQTSYVTSVMNKRDILVSSLVLVWQLKQRQNRKHKHHKNRHTQVWVKQNSTMRKPGLPPARSPEIT